MQLERYKDSSDVRYIRMRESEVEWHHSTFPDPLVTLDWTEDNQLIGIEIVGPMKEITLEPTKGVGDNPPTEPARDSESKEG